jgi:hypothetical protein
MEVERVESDGGNRCSVSEWKWKVYEEISSRASLLDSFLLAEVISHL